MVKWTRRMRISRTEVDGSACPPFWVLTVEWFLWHHHFQIASFSPSTLENSVFKKHRFQITPLWRAFSNGSVFGDRFQRCSVADSRIRSKTVPFSFENGLVWTGPQIVIHVRWEISQQNIPTIFRVWECWGVTELNVRIMWTIGRTDPCRRLFLV